QLYLATGDPSSSDDGGSAQISGSLSLAEPVACADSTGPLLCTDSVLQDCPGIEQLCVVCHYFPLSRALLPCRHTCICAVLLRQTGPLSDVPRRNHQLFLHTIGGVRTTECDRVQGFR
ncbi:hypothetical protein quinque_000231, partial [Culex quinquefasciatus]